MFMCVCVFKFRFTKHILRSKRYTIRRVIKQLFGGNVFIKQTSHHKSHEFQLTSLFAR